MEIVFLITGLVSGVLIGWLAARYLKTASGEESRLDNEKYFVSREIFLAEKQENSQKEEKINELNILLAEARSAEKNLKEKLENGKKDLEEVQERFRLEFKNLSNELLDEKSKKFLELNQKNVSSILDPLKEKIREFETKVDKVYHEETRERISLKTELKHIVELNKQVHDDTNRLTSALKGDKKLLGDWGEVQLEMILEKAGLEKEIHYRKQPNFKDEEGNNMRPDYIINLPDNKQLIIDSKVSLSAYQVYFNSEDEDVRNQALKQHINDLGNHIRDLGAKNYPRLYGINPPDYVLMFIPVEPALAAAQREDGSLFDKALKKNVVLVSTSTLLATLRTINYIWNQDKQKKNVVEIARQSGALYDKFKGFIEDLQGIGKKLDDARLNYDNAMNKLFDSPRKGDTIVGRIEKIRELGAETNKSLPQDILDRLEE